MALTVIASRAVAADDCNSGGKGPALSDLTFSNFFSAGWNEPWTRRSRGSGTPDLSLLRVQTNFLARVARTDFSFQQNLLEAKTKESEYLSETVEYALNRRFMLGLNGNYRWNNIRLGEDDEGAAGAAFVRLQWSDTPRSSLSTMVKVGLPARDLGEKQTTIGIGLAGWQDLAALGIPRLGLYYHIQEEALAGPESPSGKRNGLTYAVSLAKTWTSPDAFLGCATTFVEGYGKTDLDGTTRGATTLTITPAVRATIAKRHILMFGVEFPLTDPQPFERVFRATYIFNF